MPKLDYFVVIGGLPDELFVPSVAVDGVNFVGRCCLAILLRATGDLLLDIEGVGLPALSLDDTPPKLILVPERCD